MQQNHSLSLSSEECSSEIVRDARNSIVSVRMASSEKRAGKNIDKCVISATSSATVAKDERDRRSLNSNRQSGSSKRNLSVPSLLRERTVQSSSDAEEAIPTKENAASKDSNRKRSMVSSSTHFFNIKSALPESIILDPNKDKRISEWVQRTAQKFRKQDQIAFQRYLQNSKW